MDTAEDTSTKVVVAIEAVEDVEEEVVMGDAIITNMVVRKANIIGKEAKVTAIMADLAARELTVADSVAEEGKVEAAAPVMEKGATGKEDTERVDTESTHTVRARAKAKA